MALSAAIVGWVVGMVIGDARASTLWTAAGFAIVGTVLASGLMASGAAGASVDASLLGSVFADLFSTTVSVGYVALAIVAAAFARWGAKFKL